MKRILLVLLAILVPALNQDVFAQEFTIEEVVVIPLALGDEIVGEIADLVQDTDGNYYLPDWQQHTIWVVNAQGRLIQKIGSEGRGPGELTNPRSVVLHDERVFVLDNDNDRIAVYSSTGQHITSHRIDVFMSTGMLIDDHGNFVLSTLWGPSLFTVYDTNGTKAYEGGSREWSGRAPLVLMGAFQHMSSTPDGYVLYSPIMRYEVMKLDRDGTLLTTYVAKPPGYIPLTITPQDGGIRVGGRWSWIGRPLVVGDLVLVQRRDLLDEGRFRFRADLFTQDGEVVQQGIDIPFWFVFSMGNDLYGIDTSPVDEGEANPSIVVYRLTDE